MFSSYTLRTRYPYLIFAFVLYHFFFQNNTIHRTVVVLCIFVLLHFSSFTFVFHPIRYETTKIISINLTSKSNQLKTRPQRRGSNLFNRTKNTPTFKKRKKGGKKREKAYRKKKKNRKQNISSDKIFA